MALESFGAGRGMVGAWWEHGWEKHDPEGHGVQESPSPARASLH